MSEAGAWWREGVIYQIYPRSFQDSNGDGVGDLAGTMQRLDYLQWLGVNALWISPFYPSPMVDFGYDVADYCNVDPMFGTLDDFADLRDEAHARGVKLIVDFVPNHTSDQHPWFIESRSSRHNPKRDWYIWRDAAPDGGPPNNWISDFGGSAWQWDEATEQYYYHAFLPQQADLNWRNPDVRAAMYDVLRFWLDRGVDGFRVDVIWHLIKDATFANNPPNPDYRPTMGEMFRVLQTRSTDQEEVHDIIREMRQVLDGYDDRVLIGEIYLPVERLVRYYGAHTSGAQMPLNFHLIETPWNADAIAQLIARYEGALPAGAWPNWVLGNHDRRRIASRVGAHQARVAAMLLLTLRGTPTLYYGDELGLADVAIPPEQLRDPRELREPGLGLGRDPVRTPMQWDETPHAGFSVGAPWLPLSPDWAAQNVAAERSKPRSMLQLYKALLDVRRARQALRRGEVRLLKTGPGVLAYMRSFNGETLIVALNLTEDDRIADIPECATHRNILLSTHMDRAGPAIVRDLALRAHEGVILVPGDL